MPEIRVPTSRRFTHDIGALSGQRHLLPFLLELDVTGLWTHCREHRLSFTGGMTKVIADTLVRHPRAHAIRLGGDRLHLFDTCHVAVLLEQAVDGVLVPVPHRIPSVETRTIGDITREIRQVQRAGPAGSAAEGVSAARSTRRSDQWFARLPQWMRLLVWRRLLRSPAFVEREMGSCVVTAVGMKADIAGFAIQTSIHPVSFALGRIVERDGRATLPVTALLDHDVIDGADAVRMLSDLQATLRTYG